MTAPVGKLHDFALGLIERDPATQPRAELSPETVEQYAEHMQGGVEFPPVTLFDDSQRYWLGDGHHRVHAALVLGLTHIRAVVREGTREDAILFGLGANGQLPRTNADKRRAVTVALGLPKLAGKSDRQIAAACAVSHTFVAGIRRELSGNGCQMPAGREVTRGGTTYTMDVSAIGKNGSGAPEADVTEATPKPESAREEQAEAAAERVGHRPEEGPVETGGGGGEQDEFDHTRFVLGGIKAAEELVDTYGCGSDVADRIDPRRRKGIVRRAKRASKWLRALASELERRP